MRGPRGMRDGGEWAGRVTGGSAFSLASVCQPSGKADQELQMCGAHSSTPLPSSTLHEVGFLSLHQRESKDQKGLSGFTKDTQAGRAEKTGTSNPPPPVITPVLPRQTACPALG